MYAAVPHIKEWHVLADELQAGFPIAHIDLLQPYYHKGKIVSVSRLPREISKTGYMEKIGSNPAHDYEEFFMRF